MTLRRAPLASVSLLALAALVAVPAPAAAREHLAGSDALTRELSDPHRQQAMGDALGSLLGILLGMKAEPLAKIMDQMGDHDGARRIPRGATLVDLAGPDARHMPREVRRRVPGMMNAMGGLVGVLDDLVPQLDAVGKQFERDMAKAK